METIESKRPWEDLRTLLTAGDAIMITGFLDTLSPAETARTISRLTSEEQELLFRPFTRLVQSGTHGHGLGLSIVYRIIKKLGGKVGVESKPGEGATFYFTLPSAPRDGDLELSSGDRAEDRQARRTPLET